MHGTIIGSPKYPNISGEQQAMVVQQADDKCGITDKIQALCCDTTASNTGRINGACINLEKFQFLALEVSGLYLRVLQ